VTCDFHCDFFKAKKPPRNLLEIAVRVNYISRMYLTQAIHFFTFNSNVSSGPRINKFKESCPANVAFASQERKET
jgi:hypothetical protein